MRRLRVLCQRRRLDRDLAAGMAPWQTPDHELRAEQLVCSRSRGALALSLNEILLNAEEPPDGLPVTLARTAVERNRRSLRLLVDRLCSDRPLRPQGIALVRLLVDERTSPLYIERDDDALERRLQAALSALEAPRGTLRLAA